MVLIPGCTLGASLRILVLRLIKSDSWGLEPRHLYFGVPIDSKVQPRLRDDALDQFFSKLDGMRVAWGFY